MSAPHKLPDGSWSDRVDRRYPLGFFEFGAMNRRRVHVTRYHSFTSLWAVWRGIKRIKGCSTHAEAIAYADKAARNDH